jgi:hypothetical protein
MSEEDKEYFRSVVGIDPGVGGGSGGAALIDCDAPGAVFNKRDAEERVIGCAQAACHDAATLQSGLDLSLADPFPPLLDKRADTASLLSACQGSGLFIVDSARPELSLLYTKMFRTDDPAQTLQFSGCGVPMPYPFGPKPADAWERDCVMSWIRSKLMTPAEPIDDAGVDSAPPTDDAGLGGAPGTDDGGSDAAPSAGAAGL